MSKATPRGGRPHGRARHGRPANHFSRPPQPPSIPPAAGTGTSSCMVLIVGVLTLLGAAGVAIGRWLA